ncbi:hypothetical protein [Bacillus weihaiensis]|uniref:hypothetical protein n=1 Tax=Bacillus weihaiensis TaxID=1547283 RepID=UPI002355342B|nr:hypothetical protein [Bacillus weihaiensis]
MKIFILLTNNDRKVVVRAKSKEAAKFIFKSYSNEEFKSIRKLKLTDLIGIEEQILVLPNKEFI